MKHPLLKVEPRTVLGKKVKKLRREGLLPANIYGKDLASQAVQLGLKEFQEIFKQVGETGLVDVQLDGKAKPALIKNLQMDFRTRTPLHADFFQVNLKEKVRTMVPLVTIGEPKAVTDKLGILLQQIGELEIEALPEKLPENIEVPVEDLAEVDQQILVSDLSIPDGVTVLTDASQIVVKIGELAVEEPEEEAAETEEAATTEQAAEEAQEAGSTESEPTEA